MDHLGESRPSHAARAARDIGLRLPTPTKREPGTDEDVSLDGIDDGTLTVHSILDELVESPPPDPLVTAEDPPPDGAAQDEQTVQGAGSQSPQPTQPDIADIPELTQKSKEFVEQAIRQRVLGRSDPERAAVAHDDTTAQETVRDTQLLADGIVPGMMEGLLNQVHRKTAGRSKRDAARFLLVILKAHGAYVYEHCTRLVDLAMSLGRELGQGGEAFGRELEEGLAYRDLGEVAFFLTKRSARQRDALAAYLAGLDLAQESMLHDLGKINVPEEILYKPGRLTERERKIMERHPVWGAQILESIPPLHHAIPVTRHHHERWDGRGYPDGLGGEHIPIAARIVSVVDAFDAMVSDRPYRKALSYNEACTVIRDGAGTQFDAKVAQAFLRILPRVWSPERQY